MIALMAIPPVVTEIGRQARDRQCLQATVRATDQRSEAAKAAALRPVGARR
jgi:hypothetical protein